LVAAAAREDRAHVVEQGLAVAHNAQRVQVQASIRARVGLAKYVDARPGQATRIEKG
jgi:hypothetical protein